MKHKHEPAHRRVARWIAYACLMVIFGAILGFGIYHLLAWIVRNGS